MGSTKIINVLRDDSLKEIVELFRDTPAQEVIFVLPKKSKSFKNEADFSTLKSEADKLGKTVSLLCSNPDLNLIAKNHGFEVLTAKEPTPRPPRIKTVVQQDLDQDEELEAEQDYDLQDKAEDVEEGLDEDINASEDDEAEEYEVKPRNYRIATTAARNSQLPVRTPQRRQGLDDIVRPLDGKNLKVSQKKTSRVSLDVKTDPKPIARPDTEFENIWQSIDRKGNFLNENESDGKTFWDKLSFSGKTSNKKTVRHVGTEDRSKKVVVILGAASLILISAILYISLGSAKVLITPKKQPLNLQLKVSVSDKFSTVDSSFNKIPGQLFNIEKSASQTFPASGQKEVAQKARGTITIYNEFGSAPQILIATTRFESKTGLIFRTLKTVTVPGTKVVNGKVTPGSVAVEVIADKPGQIYNIEASQFGISAFKEKGDTERYEKIYGKSDQPMKGGISGLAKVVTADDYNLAKKTLSDNVLAEVLDTIKSQTNGFKIVDTSSASIGTVDSTAQADEAADDFNMTVKGSITTIGFRPDDLNKLIKEYIEKTGSFTVIPDKLNLSFDKVSLDKNQGILTFVVTIDGNIYGKIDEDKIGSDLMGKNTEQIREYFGNTAAIETVKVVLSPFWVKKVPKNVDRIRFNVTYD